MPVVLWADVPIDQRGEPWMTRRRHPRLWFTADRSRLVTDGDPAADSLALGQNEDPIAAIGPLPAIEASRRRVLFLAWLDANQPREPLGCPAAIRDRSGLYHPCRHPSAPGAFCRSHDPEVIAAAVRQRAALRVLRIQWCNWVGEGVPA